MGKQMVGFKLPMAAWGVALCCALLVGCGGGGGDKPEDGGGSGNGNGNGGGVTPPVAALDPAQLKGRWSTAAGAAPGFTAVVLPDASGGTASAWVLAQDASRLVKLAVRGDGSAVGSASGRSYALGGNAASQTVAGQVTAVLTATPKSMSVTGVNTGALALTQADAMTTPAVQGDAAGTWRAALGGNASSLQWALSAAGVLDGTSTTGCSYAGTVGAMAAASAYTVQFTESCADGSKTAFAGVGTLNPAKTGLTVAVTSTDESRGAALFLAK